MGVNFLWFKDYKIEESEYHVHYFGIGYPDPACSLITFINYDDTSHSYGNVSKLQEIFKKINCEIPTIQYTIDYDTHTAEKYIQSKLINPSELSKKCQELLDSDIDLDDMRDRIEWIKELSDDGYYVSYIY